MNENNEFLNGKPAAEEIAAKKTRKPRTKKEDIPLTEAVEVDETTDLVTIDKKIDQDLEKQNITEAVLKALEDEYLNLTIVDINDKEGYQKVAKAETLCRNTRTLAVKLCKAGRSNAIAEQRAWIKKQDYIEDRVFNVESKLKERRKVIDDAIEAIKEAKAIAEQKLLQERAVGLIALGMNFDGESYILEDIKISVLQVKQLDQFTFGQLLASVETKFKENQEIKAREEELRLIAEANNKRILEEALAKEEENKKKEADLLAREEAIRQAEAKAKSDAEALIKAKEDEAKRQHEAQIAQIEKETADRLKARKSSLFQLGFAMQGDQFLLLGMNVPEKELIEFTDDQFNKMLDDVTKESARIKASMEEQRIAKEEQMKKDAAEAERKKIENEQALKAKFDAELKLKEEARIAERQDEENRIASLAPDSEKLNIFCKMTMDVPLPEYSTDSYKAFLETMKTMRIEYLKALHGRKPK